MRVLNLWQKNAVFKSDIIQPLLDMAAGIPPPSVTPVIPSSAAPVNNTTPGQSEYIHSFTVTNLFNTTIEFDELMVGFITPRSVFRHPSYSGYPS